MAPALNLAWVIVYVPDVRAAIALYGEAFGLTERFVTPDGDYGELDTGTTVLAFASDALGASNFRGGPRRPGLDEPPANIELAFTTADVAGATETALAAGCTLLAAPADKQHGQTVAYVRDPWGTLIELCTPSRSRDAVACGALQLARRLPTNGTWRATRRTGSQGRERCFGLPASAGRSRGRAGPASRSPRCRRSPAQGSSLWDRSFPLRTRQRALSRAPTGSACGSRSPPTSTAAGQRSARSATPAPSTRPSTSKRERRATHRTNSRRAATAAFGSRSEAAGPGSVV